MTTKSLVITGCLLAMGLVHCSKVLDAVGNVGSYLVSDEEEVAMGANFHQEITGDGSGFSMYTDKPSYNAALVSYVDSLGQLIASNQTDRPDIKYTFTVIDDDTTVNAFATPGGYVYLYTGLILQAEYESEIASVIAHELGHITKRHGVKQLVANSTTDFILDLIVGDSTMLRSVVDLANGLSFLKYSRDNEYEADSLAVEYTTSAGLNPTGVKTFMEYLASLGDVFEPLATHPDGDNRVEAIERVIGQQDASVLTRPNPYRKVSP